MKEENGEEEGGEGVCVSLFTGSPGHYTWDQWITRETRNINKVNGKEKESAFDRDPCVKGKGLMQVKRKSITCIIFMISGRLFQIFHRAAFRPLKNSFRVQG